MRTRTKQKRQEIIEKAASLFVEQGYERTSMNAISERAGGSKATLYGYFQSKEDLFRAVLAHSVEEEAEGLMAEFPEDESLRTGLIRLGERYLRTRLAPLPIANSRILSNQPEGGLGVCLYSKTFDPAWRSFAGRVEALMDQGRLRRADPWVAAMHWKGLNEGELLEKRLLGAMVEVDLVKIRKVATDAAVAFLRIYGAEVEAG